MARFNANIPDDLYLRLQRILSERSLSQGRKLTVREWIISAIKKEITKR